MDKINILIIEDDKEYSDMLVQILKENNFTVAGVARTFKEAITMYESEEIDFVSIDIYLEGQPGGINFAEWLDVQSGKKVPFIFLTSAISRVIFNRAKLTKPYAYLVKPINELEYIYAIETAVEKSRNSENL